LKAMGTNLANRPVRFRSAGWEEPLETPAAYPRTVTRSFEVSGPDGRPLHVYDPETSVMRACGAASGHHGSPTPASLPRRCIHGDGRTAAADASRTTVRGYGGSAPHAAGTWRRRARCGRHRGRAGTSRVRDHRSLRRRPARARLRGCCSPTSSVVCSASRAGAVRRRRDRLVRRHGGVVARPSSQRRRSGRDALLTQLTSDADDGMDVFTRAPTSPPCGWLALDSAASRSMALAAARRAHRRRPWPSSRPGVAATARITAPVLLVHGRRRPHRAPAPMASGSHSTPRAPSCGCAPGRRARLGAQRRHRCTRLASPPTACSALDLQPPGMLTR